MTKDELKSWRKRHKLTQAKAAEMLGYSLPAYQAWEYGTNRIPLLVAKFCAVSDILFFFTPEQ